MVPNAGDCRWQQGASDEQVEPLLGYPVLTSAPDGQPIYAFIPILQRPRRRSRCWPDSSTCALIFLLALGATATFFLWPRTLVMTVADIDLTNVHFNIKKGDSFIPQVFLDLNLDLRLRAHNPNFFGVTYENATVSILFEDEELAQVEAFRAELDALSDSYVNATLDLHGYRIASNVLRLLADVASKAVPLQTITACKGYINVLFLRLPLEGKATCNLVVNPQDESITSQDCTTNS